MRKTLFALIAILLIVNSVNAQKIEITPIAGYMFGGSVNFIEGKLKIKDDLSYGGMMSFKIDRDVAVEFSYVRMDTRAEWRSGYIYAPDYPNRNFDLNVNYMTIGAVRESEIADNIKGFGTLALGAAYFNPSSSTIKDVWRFAGSLAAGVKLYLTDRIGIRLQGRLLLPMYFAGGGAYCGVGSGGSSCGLGVSTTAVILQGDLSGGLIIALGD